MKNYIFTISLIAGMSMVSCKNSPYQFEDQDSDTNSTSNRLSNSRTGGDEIANEDIASQSIQGGSSGLVSCEVETADMSGGKWVSGTTKVEKVICPSEVKAAAASYVFCQKSSLGDLECAPFVASINFNAFGISKAATVNAANHAQCLQIAKENSSSRKTFACFVIDKTKSL